MSKAVVGLVMLICYLVGMLVVGLYGFKAFRKTAEDYFVASRVLEGS